MDIKYTKNIQEQILGGNNIRKRKEKEKSPSCIIFAVQI